MRAFGRWALLVVSILTCVSAGYAAFVLAGRSWDAVVEYESPYVSFDAPTEKSREPLADQVVVVIVDGLRLDASRRMPTLNALRRNGADLELTASQPSLTTPNGTTILSGAPPHISGVVTNWHEGPAPIETVFDTAKAAGVPSVFVGSDDYEQLYGVKTKCIETFMRPWKGEYLSGVFVDEAIRLSERHEPGLVIVHLPDVDEAGHDFGGASVEYASTASRVDDDLRRLVEALQSPRTSFVVVSDHGHIDTGGHGGWEPDVVIVPAVVTGPSVLVGQGSGDQAQIAPTVARLAGLTAPGLSLAQPFAGSRVDRSAAAEHMARVIMEPVQVDTRPAAPAGTAPATVVADAADARRAWDQQQRLPYALGLVLAASIVTVMIGLTSWRALVSGLAGTVGYYALYNALFFGMHGYRWSLSSFNSEDLVEGWMNMRLVEAAVCGLFAVAVAAAVYPLLRRCPKSPAGKYLAGWLTLGPVTILVVLVTLAIQVAWFGWAWGIFPEWTLPDLKWAFKYDLDLIQATALGFVAVVSPVVSWLVARIHPSIRRNAVKEQ